MKRSPLVRARTAYARQADLAREAVSLLEGTGALARLDAIFEEKRVLSMELNALETSIAESLELADAGEAGLQGFERAQTEALLAEDLLCQTLKKLDKSKILNEHFDPKLKSKAEPGKRLDIAQ